NLRLNPIFSSIFSQIRAMDWIIGSFKHGLQQMTWLEGIAVVFGISSVYYSMKENNLVFPTGVISTLIYVWICLTVGLYADMGINAYYFSMSIYGWYIWSRPDEKGAVLPVTWLNGKERWETFLFFLASYALLVFILFQFTDSDVPFIDSFTTASAFVGMYLMAKKKVENWIAWIITDLISIPLYWYKGLILTS